MPCRLPPIGFVVKHFSVRSRGDPGARACIDGHNTAIAATCQLAYSTGIQLCPRKANDCDPCFTDTPSTAFRKSVLRSMGSRRHRHGARASCPAHRDLAEARHGAPPGYVLRTDRSEVSTARG